MKGKQESKVYFTVYLYVINVLQELCTYVQFDCSEAVKYEL